MSSWGVDGDTGEAWFVWFPRFVVACCVLFVLMLLGALVYWLVGTL